jgi:hypothetical protein
MSLPNRPALQSVARSAIGTELFAGSVDRQENAGVRVPEQHPWHRAVQREILFGDLDVPLSVDGFLFSHDLTPDISPDRAPSLKTEFA